MRVLVVEDDAGLREQLRTALAAAGYAVDVAVDGDAACHLGATEPVDAAVLDLGLPGKDGLAVLRDWRAAGCAFPVVVLTARGTWRERVLGIDSGADDYLPKPFEMEELLARLRAVIRRTAGHADARLVLGGLALDTRTCRVTLDGRSVPLTALEYRVLAYLVHHRDRVVPRAELVEHLYAQDFERDSNTVDVFIARLRRKLGSGSIRTVRGLGFQAAAP